MRNISMVDLKSQYQKIKSEIDLEWEAILSTTSFINGPVVKNFAANLGQYLDASHVIPCANGTDALQIALMALDLEPGDEVITTPFSFIATVEVIALLRLKPVFVDVEPGCFNMNVDQIEALISPRTKAVIPVHLFGQCTNMSALQGVCLPKGIKIIEDNAQAIGANTLDHQGNWKKAGTVGDIGCTSFYPSKNLGCYGDGGAIFTNDDLLGKKLKCISNHGSRKKYYHNRIGVNSRLDSLQAAVLNVKLKHLDAYIQARQQAAAYYDQALG
ncbi:MAG: DegT/DnrJ/EryC1/StrS family aminotransferase, partial [Bacteroidota bacterium]